MTAEIIAGIAALISAICLILLIVLLAKQGNAGKTQEKIETLAGKTDALSGKLDSEFERSRREQAGREGEMRRETAGALSGMTEKMEKLRIDNSDRQAKLENSLAGSLNAMMKENSEQNEKLSKQISETLDKMRESNEKKLDEMRATVDEKLTATLSTRLDSSFKTVSERLESVYKSLGEVKELSSGVTGNITALNRILSNVKARGTWAEVQLGSILDQTVPGMYETNFMSAEKGDDRVEFAVRIPTNDGSAVYLPVDSKFPLEDYVRLCDAADSADAAALDAARKALETRVLNEAKKITKYINVPLTTPFAILYLATEGLYAEIASSRTGLPERIMSEHNVMIAGPSTITALLNSLSLGFRTVAINEKANEVRALLGAVRQQYDKFGDLIAKARKKIDEAGSTLDDADKRNNIIRKKLGSVEEVDTDSADSLLGITEGNKASE